MGIGGISVFVTTIDSVMEMPAGPLPRNRVHEIMDDGNLRLEDHREALVALQSINRLSRAAQRLMPSILSLAKKLGTNRLRMLDVACGGGDVPLALAQLAAQHSITLELTLLDRSDTAVNHASVAAKNLGLTCTALVGDVLLTDMPHADIVSNSLFLHHLDAPEVVLLLRRLAEHTDHMLLVSDLMRSRLGLFNAAIACRILTRSSIVHHDGPASVRAAWTIDELRDMARQAGLASATVRPVFPWRMVLEYHKGQAG